MAMVFESLWNRYRPGCSPVGYAIRFRQWTAIHLSPTQLESGVIPLTHAARLLTFDRPPGPTKVTVNCDTYRGERVGTSLVVPPTLLHAPVIQLRHTQTGFLITHDPPNLTATNHLLTSLRRAGWTPNTDLMDAEGTHIIPALLRATAAYPPIRRQPTLPLTLIPGLTGGIPGLTGGGHTLYQPVRGAFRAGRPIG